MARSKRKKVIKRHRAELKVKRRGEKKKSAAVKTGEGKKAEGVN
ncbi:MAG: hypothetical protein NTZ51_02865 [Proteobacteria bacterium]|nr:hypothetical protein [Pseudomonadota bacterium]